MKERSYFLEEAVEVFFLKLMGVKWEGRREEGRSRRKEGGGKKEEEGRRREEGGGRKEKG